MTGPADSPVPPRGRGRYLWLGGILAGAAAVSAGAALGIWYLPFVAGVLLGTASGISRPGRGLTGLGLLLIGPVSWAFVLAFEALNGAAITGTARTAAALAGLPALPAVTIGLALLIALALAAAGLWLGRAISPARTAPRQPRRAIAEPTARR